jgi:hypothetical protein
MTLGEFRQLYPEFASELDTRIQYYLDEASYFMETCRWSHWYEKGLGLYAAHQIALANSLSNGTAAIDEAGGFTSKRVGDIALAKDGSFFNKQADNPFMRTVYGQQWVYYQKLAGSGAVAV